MFQENFLQKIKAVISEKLSLNEEIAKILDISYDAAHRRTTYKSKFSLEESVLLARKFNISLDGLFEVSSNNLVVVEKTKEIKNEQLLQQYFEDTYCSLKQLLPQKEAHIYYSAKDIPIFYTLKDNKLSHFKFYVWLRLLDSTFRTKNFDEYFPKLATMQAANKLGKLYKNLKTSEIWDITTINSTLKQIHFYFKAGQLNLQDALELCDLLKELLNEISDKVLSKESSFHLYYKELLLMNNNVFITTKNQNSLYVPFTMLTYFLTSDEKTCLEAKAYFDKQLTNSKLLNTSGEKEQNAFYNRMMQKIDALKQLLSAEKILDFQ